MQFTRTSALSVFVLAMLTASLRMGTGAPAPIVSITTVTEVPVLLNGGFEQGLAGWEELHGEGGSYGISNSIVHSGSGALVLGLRPSRPGGTPSGAVEGVSQNVSVSQLRGLRAEAWYETAINTNDAAVRLVVQAGKLALSYYVFFGPQITNASVGDTQTSRSILLRNNLCPSWCSIDIDVAADFRRLFDPNNYHEVFLSEDLVQMVVSLELVIYLTTSPQYIFWDDVNATAQILSFQTTATTTSTPSATTQSSSPEVYSSRSATSTLSLESITTTSRTTTGQSALGAPLLSLNLTGLLLPGALVMVIVALAIDLVRRFQVSTGRVQKNTRCPECGTSSPVGSNFCDACGTRLAK